jgi:predicted nucleic acid-binding protein
MPDVFIDTDVAFDILSKREPHFRNSLVLLELASEGAIRLLISESSLANLFYLSFDIYKIESAASKLTDLVSTCEIVHAGKDAIMRSLQSPFKDKEDALQYYSALHAKADYFVTRNKRDYKHSNITLPVFTPIEFAKVI